MSYIMTEEHKNNIRIACNKKEVKEKLSKSIKEALNKPEVKAKMRKHKSEEHKNSLSRSIKIVRNKQEIKEKIDKAIKIAMNKLEVKQKMRKPRSEEGRRNIKAAANRQEYKDMLSNSRMRENNPNWQGGVSFEDYALDFNKRLKEFIRNRDSYKCQLCDAPEIECDRKLSIHHIDYNKKNSSEVNLISLCVSCNSKVNKNRKYFEEYFTQLMISKIKF